MRKNDDSGQLMLVSGIVITIAFLLTALTLSQVSAIERQSASDKPTSLTSEWRFLHDRLATNLATAVTTDSTNASFLGSTWPAVAATFRNIEAEKGYDLVLRLAGNTTGGPNFNLTENRTGVTTSGVFTSYNIKSFSGSYVMTFAADGTDDGLLWNPSCPAAGGSRCLQGVLVAMHLSDATTSLDEVVLFAVNEP
jgi:hypothetical protein